MGRERTAGNPALGGRVILGTGLLALDVVVSDTPRNFLRLQAGGTCGNVLAALAYLGWSAYPIARLGDDGAMRRVRDDLEHWGVRLDFVARRGDVGTPVIAQYIRWVAGEPTHSFAFHCPICGAETPRYKPLRISDVDPLLSQFPIPDVFFFDRVAASTIRLAEHFRAAGALIVYEPSGIGDQRLFQQAVEAAHVVKFSRQRIDLSEHSTGVDTPKVFIATDGHEGLTFKLLLPRASTRRWRNLAAVRASRVVDTAGCGDWCTAGFLSCLTGRGASGLLAASDEEIVEALRYGQALAAWNCGFEGARGGMYDTTREEFETTIRMLLTGGAVRDHFIPTPRTEAYYSQQFNCSACPTPKQATGA